MFKLYYYFLEPNNVVIVGETQALAEMFLIHLHNVLCGKQI
jgi:hypothetical protein